MDLPAKKLAVDLGRRLRRFRQDRSLTQAEVAEAAGIEPDTVGRLERGLRLPSLAVLAKLAETLGVAPVDLLADDATWAAAAGAAPHQRQLVDAALRVPVEQADAAHRMLRSLIE
jgi:transcriptional regulator with XRE-family HTH domain